MVELVHAIIIIILFFFFAIIYHHINIIIPDFIMKHDGITSTMA